VKDSETSRPDDNGFPLNLLISKATVSHVGTLLMDLSIN
jgi:hypothetical protein